MKKLLLLLFILAAGFYTGLAQQNVGINTTTPDPSAALHVESANQGVLVPRLTTEQRELISNAATGLLVFDTDTGSFWFYNGTTWLDLSAPAQLADADQDTKIQVEKYPNENLIRFDLDGTERLVFRKNNPVGNQLQIEFPNSGENIFLGTGAGYGNTTGSFNTFLGFWAGQNNTEGNINTFLGRFAGAANTTGSGNTFLGHEAGNRNINGGDNTFLGSGAGFNNHTGNRNVYIGLSAGLRDSTGSNNVFLGFEAGMNEKGSHRLYIESSAADSANALIYGEFDHDRLRINGKLEVREEVKAVTFLGDGSQLTGLLPAGPQAGDITYYDGSAWQVLEPAAEGEVLTLNSGIPAWKTPSIKTDNLLQVGLPDGNILYVHPTDNSTGIRWGDFIDIPRVDDITTMDFKGAANTLAIVNALGDFNSGAYAAKLCADLVAFGFDDWYLPAAGELNMMYQQLGPTTNGFEGSGDMPTGFYWSSSEYSASFARYQHFIDGNQYLATKGSADPSCRCVRR
jgi:hypothetical protein